MVVDGVILSMLGRHAAGLRTAPGRQITTAGNHWAIVNSNNVWKIVCMGNASIMRINDVVFVLFQLLLSWAPQIMSWWDYGYQITAMGNRTVIVDNNTWNNTHIATVGRAMASYEDEAYVIMKQLDVSYVLVVFGGLTGYSSDDINK